MIKVEKENNNLNLKIWRFSILLILVIILIVFSIGLYFNLNSQILVYLATIFVIFIAGAILYVLIFRQMSRLLENFSESTIFYIDSNLEKRERFYYKKMLENLNQTVFQSNILNNASKDNLSSDFAVIDTSSLIDGRILGVINTNFLSCKIVVPQSVIQELQLLADNSFSEKRLRGRRGLDILNEMKQILSKENISVINYVSDAKGVDDQLIQMALDYNAKLITVDYNLLQAARVHGIQVLNINELVNKLKADILPDDILVVKIIREGRVAGQGIGYLEDGTMVIVNKAQSFIGQSVEVVVEKVLQKETGKMVFGNIMDLDIIEY